MTILMTGLFFVTASSAISQETCKSAEKLTQDNASGTELYAQRDCWLRKMKTGAPNLSGAYLRDINLSKMDLSGRNFTRADLSGANLQDADLSFANLNWANLSGANVTGAVSGGASLKDIKLADGAYIVRLRLKNMICTMSDDEGPRNDADMGLFNITVNGIVLYYWKTTNVYTAVTTAKGYNWKVDREILFAPESGRGISFDIYGEAHEFDPIGDADEKGANRTRFEVYKERGAGKIIPHEFTISSADFSFTINLEAEILTS